MTEKELKRLSRSELLELLLIQTKETERLTKELEETKKLLSDRYLRIEKAGDLAHAVLEINGVMAAAQAAAKQYLDNIVRMEQEMKLHYKKIPHPAQNTAAYHSDNAPKMPKPTSTGKSALDEMYALLEKKNK